MLAPYKYSFTLHYKWRIRSWWRRTRASIHSTSRLQLLQPTSDGPCHVQLCGTVAIGIASHFPLTAFNIVASLVLVLIPVIVSFHNLYCDIVQSRAIVLLLLFFFSPGTALWTFYFYFYKFITRIIIIKTEFESFKNCATLSKAIAEKEVLTDPHMRTRPMLFSVQSQPDTLFPNLKRP